MSLLALYKGKGSIKAWCQLAFNKGKALEGDPELHVHAVNSGKRPVILNYLSLKTPNGYTHIPLKPLAPVLDAGGNVVGIADILMHEIGIKLEEGQMHHVIFGSRDWTQLYDGEDNFSREIYFEDSFGKKHKVRNSRKVVSRYLDIAISKGKDVLPDGRA